jgi:aminomethyltransferase
MQVELLSELTSGTMSPSMNKGIGLGYVTIANAAVDSDIYIRIRKMMFLPKW